MEVLWTYFLGIWWNVSLHSKQHPDYDFENCYVEKDVSMERLEFALSKTAGNCECRMIDQDSIHSNGRCILYSIEPSHYKPISRQYNCQRFQNMSFVMKISK